MKHRRPSKHYFQLIFTIDLINIIKSHYRNGGGGGGGFAHLRSGKYAIVFESSVSQVAAAVTIFRSACYRIYFAKLLNFQSKKSWKGAQTVNILPQRLSSLNRPYRPLKYRNDSNAQCRTISIFGHIFTNAHIFQSHTQCHANHNHKRLNVDTLNSY